MSLKIKGIGGYHEFGKNMTMVDVDGKIILLDMGLNMEEYVLWSEQNHDENVDVQELIEMKILPDIFMFKDRFKDVIAIVPSHTHLDHFGSIKFFLDFFPNAKVYATPYTAQVIKSDFYFSKRKIPDVQATDYGTQIDLADDIKLEFVYVTHSTPHSSVVCLTTKYGRVVYTDDFKIDRAPVLGPLTDTKRLSELDNTIALIMDSTNSPMPGRTKTETDIKNQLFELFEELNKKAEKIIISTFSSHLSRLKTIKEASEHIGRIPVFVGRSLAKYIYAAHDINLVKIADNKNISMFPSKSRKIIREINDNPKKYVLVTTGHQGEPNANLSKIADGINKLNISDKDYLVFSSDIIPVESSVENRKILEEKFAKKGLNIIKDIHTSGHGNQEEILEMIDLVKPINLLPNNADKPFCTTVERIAIEHGFDKNHILQLGVGDEVEFKDILIDDI